MGTSLNKFDQYGPLGVMLGIALMAIVYLFRELRKSDKEKFEIIEGTNKDTVITIKSINDTMKAILIAIDTKNEIQKEKDHESQPVQSHPASN